MTYILNVPRGAFGRVFSPLSLRLSKQDLRLLNPPAECLHLHFCCVNQDSMTEHEASNKVTQKIKEDMNFQNCQTLFHF